MYYNYPYYSDRKEHAFSGTLENLRLHVGHCIENIRQNLMCSADFNLLGFVHVAGREPFPDFGTEHTCRNFDDVRDFASRRRRDKPYNATEFPLREGDLVLEVAP